jgi:hypothetical protein
LREIEHSGVKEQAGLLLNIYLLTVQPPIGAHGAEIRLRLQEIVDCPHETGETGIVRPKACRLRCSSQPLHRGDKERDGRRLHEHAFRQINKATGNRLRQQLIDEETREPVAPEHKGRGYEVAKGQYLIVEDAELDAIEIESTHTIEIDGFVPRARIDQRFFDTPYYVTPSEPVGQEAFAVIREAMRGKGMVALGRLVLSKRERVIALQAYDKGLADGASAMPAKWNRPVFSFRFYEGKISRALIVSGDFPDLRSEPYRFSPAILMTTV